MAHVFLNRKSSSFLHRCFFFLYSSLVSSYIEQYPPKVLINFIEAYLDDTVVSNRYMASAHMSGSFYARIGGDEKCILRESGTSLEM